MKRALLVVAVAIALSACGEKPQALKDNPKQDTAAFTGTGMAFTAAGWKVGDETSWETHMKTRTQNGQDEYNKVH
jgi:hypothetical protein